MDYIINPIWFYLFQFIAGVRVLFIIASILAGIAAIVIFIYICCVSADIGDCTDSCFSYSEKRLAHLTTTRTLWLKQLKKVITWFIIIIVVAIAIPTQETIMRMMIAHFATYDNVGMVFSKIIEGAQYVLDKIAPVAQAATGN